jgi:hypothetical protein
MHLTIVASAHPRHWTQGVPLQHTQAMIALTFLLRAPLFPLGGPLQHLAFRATTATSRQVLELPLYVAFLLEALSQRQLLLLLPPLSHFRQHQS